MMAIAATSEIVRSAVQEGGWTPGQVEVMRRLFARGASDDEFAVFLRLAAKYELDPMAREIWCVVDLNEDGTRKLDRAGEPKPPMITASRSGWRKVAQRDVLCAGIESGAVFSGDVFRRRPDGSVEHEIALTERGKIVGAYGLVWRHDWRLPAFAWAPWVEYGQPVTREGGRADGKLINRWSPWSRYASAMIEKQAESMALRQAFPLGGLTPGGDDEPDPEALAAGSTPAVLTPPEPVDMETPAEDAEPREEAVQAPAPVTPHPHEEPPEPWAPPDYPGDREEDTAGDEGEG